MYATQQPLNDEHHLAEEGEFEIEDLKGEDDDDQPKRGMRRSRSIGSRRGGPSSRSSRSSSGDSVSSSTSKRRTNSRSRSNSVGRMSHRQRSRAMMASPSKYGRGGLRRDKESGELDAHSTATTVADDLSDEPSPSLPEGDNDSNHQLRQRLSEMTEMATVSPSVYRKRKQMIKKRLSAEKMETFSNLTISTTNSTEGKGGKKNTPENNADDMSQLKLHQDDHDDEAEMAMDTPSVHSASIDRQQKREQAALEEVMSMVSKSKKSSSGRRSSDRSVVSASRSISSSSGNTPREMEEGHSKKPIRRAQSLNVGVPSISSGSRGPSRRALKTAESASQKKERRDKVKSNLGMFVKDEYS